MSYPVSLLQVTPRDLSPYRKGGTGIDFVHRFDSGVPGPHVMINSLTKGNEICGSEAVATLLDRGLRPTRGILSLSFANVEAYKVLDVRNPGPAKFLDVNFNRIWNDSILDGGGREREVKRARELRPIIREVDALLDLLSDCYYRAPGPWYDPPLLSYIEKPAARAVAGKIGFPLHHIGCPARPSGEHSCLLFEYRRFSDLEDPAVGMLAECGPHFANQSVENALNVSARFLLAMGVIEAEAAAQYGALEPAGEVRTYTDMLAPQARSDEFAWAGDFHGHETFNKNDLIATDGGDELRAPWDDCVLITVGDQIKKGDGVGHLIRRIS